MKYIDEFRNKKLIEKSAGRLRSVAPQGLVKIMEVCGTHTQSFRRFGLDKMLPAGVRLIAGPGCPVCVSPQRYIDASINLAGRKNTIIVTFGDMLRVPGNATTLEKERAEGASVRVVYSPQEALGIARQHLDKRVIFLGVGFETTAPTVALTILAAKKQKIRNLYFFISLKRIIPAMRYLLEDKRLDLKGFLCPGHVSAIIGARSYAFIARRYKIPCVISGFEPLDILQGLYIILKQIKDAHPQVANEYCRVVRQNGNPQAQVILRKVFKVADVQWRGFGQIPESGFQIRGGYADFDAEKVFRLNRKAKTEDRRLPCRCGEVLKGIIEPPGCRLFAKVCSPENPVGPCMVSSEGACNAYYRYR